MASKPEFADATTANAVARIRNEGFIVLESLLSREQVQRIRAELAPYLQRQHMGRNDFEGFKSERVYALLAKAPSVAEIVEHPAVLPIVDAFKSNF